MHAFMWVLLAIHTHGDGPSYGIGQRAERYVYALWISFLMRKKQVVMKGYSRQHYQYILPVGKVVVLVGLHSADWQELHVIQSQTPVVRSR